LSIKEFIRLVYHVIYFHGVKMVSGAGVAQSVWRLGYGLDDRGSIPGGGSDDIFSLRHCFQTGSGAHPAYLMCTGGSFLGVRGPGRVTDRSSPSSAEVKNEWSYTSIHQIRLHGVVLN
jgi:hypothetical protein